MQFSFPIKTARVIAVCLALLGATACGPSGGSGANQSLAAPVSDPGSTPVNRAPVATNDAVTVAGTSLDVMVLSNDSDADGDTLRILSVSTPQKGTAQIHDNGTTNPTDDFIRYTPFPLYNGPDTFSYSIFDGVDGTASGEVLLTVLPDLNSVSVVAVGDAATTLAGEYATVNVLGNDVSGTSDPLRITVLSEPNHGAAVVADNGTANDTSDDYIVYIPAPGYAGTDSLIYSVSNGQSSASAAVNITVTAPTPATPPATPAPSLPPAGMISGNVSKGPVAGAQIAVYAAGDDGHRMSTTPVAQTVTDATGHWTLSDPLPGQQKIIVASGGKFVDEAHAISNIAARRIVTLPANEMLEGVMPATDDYLALTVYVNALLIKSRRETIGGNFASVYANNRANSAAAFGFDIVSTMPDDPVDPNPGSAEGSRAYALALGGAAYALNRIGLDFGLSTPQPETIRALIRDLSECDLNGQDLDGPITVALTGPPRNITDTINLNLEILRFRNNRVSDFGTATLPVIDTEGCGTSGVLPDTTAPLINGVPASFAVASAGATGTPVNDANIQALLAGVTALDDRDGPTLVSHDAPALFPIGTTVVTFSSTDAAGNIRTLTTTIKVVAGNAPVLTVAVGALVATEGMPFFSDLSFYFSDPDGDALGFTADGLPPSMLLDPVSGIITGTPTSYDVIRAPFTVTIIASDGELAVTDTFLLGIAGVNEAPELVVPIGDRTASLGTPYALNAGAYFYDADGDNLVFALTGLPAISELSFDPVTGRISGVPTDTDLVTSPMLLTISASDGVLMASDSFTLTVINDNTAPQVIAPSATQFATEDIPFFQDVSTLFSDPDGDVLTYSATGLPASLTLDATTGLITGTPVNGDAITSTFAVLITASDGDSVVSNAYTITVANVNDPPTLTSPIGLQAALQDIGFALDVAANFDDIDSTTLTYSATGLPPTFTLNPVTGIISGTPLATDVASAPFTVTVTASDGSLSVSDTFTLNINLVNSAPVLVTPLSAQAGVQGTAFSMNFAANFADPDGNALNYLVSGLPTGTGLVLDVMTGQLFGTPGNADWLASPLVLTITATDGALSVSDTFALTISNLNDAPVVQSAIGVQSGTQDTPYSLDVSGNFADPDNDTLTFGANGLPASLLLDPATGIISGTLTNADVLASPIAITVTASDGSLSVSQSFGLSVTNVNDQPTLQSPVGAQSGTQGTPFNLNLAASFSDPDGDTLIYSLTGLATGTGLVVDPASGFVAGIPTNNDWLASPYLLTVTANDGASSVSDAFTLTINNLNDAPIVATAIGPQSGTEDALTMLDISGNFADPDNDTLTYTATGLPPSLTLDLSNGVISGAPTNADAMNSPFAVNVTASDATDAVTDTFALTIINTNDAPTLASAIADQSGTQGTFFSLNVYGNFDDIDNDILSFAVSGLPVSTGLTMHPVTGVLSGTPTHQDATASPLLITVTASDADDFASDTFTLSIADINEAPYELTPIPPATAYEDVPFALDTSDYFVDPDLDALNYSISGLPAGTGLIIDPVTGEITGTPNASDFAASPITVTVTVQDPALLSVVSSFTLTVDSQADVDLTISVDETVPTTGTMVTITVRLDNYGPSDATGVSVSVPLPAGLSYLSASAGSGSYAAGSGLWSGIAVDNGSNKILSIDATVTASPIEFLIVEAEIIAANQNDPDTSNSDLLDIVVVGAGVDVEWQGGDSGGPSDWNIGNNWEFGTVPGPFDDITIPDTANDPILGSSRSAARLDVKSGANLELNGHTLTIFGEARADGRISGSCATSVLRMVAGNFRGDLPAVEVAGPVETGGDAVIFCDLTITGGRLRLRNNVFVAGDFATENTGILHMRDGGKYLRVIDDVVFDGGDHSQPISGNPPLKTGLIYVGGDFTQTGNPHSFAAEKEHTVVLEGAGSQTVFLASPDNSSPDEDTPPLTGSRFARLRIDKDATDGVVDFTSDVAVLKYIEITEDYSPVLTSSTGSQMIAGGMRIEDILAPQTYSATFDGLPLVLVEGDDLKELDGVLFTNMQADLPQISIIRPDLDNLHDGKSFNNLVFDTYPNLAAGGAYILAHNTNSNQTKNLTLTVNTSYPLHGEPWTDKSGNFTIVWGLPTDDTDNDGLTDADEFIQMTNPVDPDTDDDGLGDRLELDIGDNPFVPAAKIFYVDAITGNDAQDGLSWATAVQTNAALFAGPISAVTGTAADPVHILYATGTYDPLMIVGRQHMIIVGSLGPTQYVPLQPYDSLFGPGAATGVVIEDSQNLLLLGLSLSGSNNPGGSGGGIILRGASGSDAVLRNVEIFGNHADRDGGGFLVAAGSQLILEDSVVSGNSAGGQGTGIGGGGGAVFGGLTMRNSYIADNYARGIDAEDGGGGLLLANSAPVTISNSMMLANYATNYGGAALIQNIGAPASIKNNLIMGNAVENATGAGLEIRNINSGYPLLIESNTLAHNQAVVLEDIAGGMNLINAASTETRNNILFDNQDAKNGDRSTDNYMDDTGLAIVEYNNITKDPTGGSGGNLDEDPLFEDGFYLRNISDSIDAGGTLAELAGLGAPYTTDKDGVGDVSTLDQGYHYQGPSSGDVADVLVISSACYAPGELTMVIRPRVDHPLISGVKIPFGPGQLVGVEDSDLTPTGRIKDESTITNIKPDGGSTRIAMDEGNGNYRFTVVNVNVINDEVEIDVYVNHAAPKKVKSPKVDTIPGC